MSGGDQKLEVIRELLAKAEKAATPDEASAYNAKAAEMMAAMASARRCSPLPASNRTRSVNAASHWPIHTRRRKRSWQAWSVAPSAAAQSGTRAMAGARSSR